ncbi:MAG: IS110 family transposase [Acidobacteriota bacterium]|nr:IS110 family transposase [Acidobacteriota bacterium]
MTVYIGVDLHARQQTLAFVDTHDGEIKCRELHHQKEDVAAFYRQFTGEVIVGVEASGYTNWFEELIEQLGYTLLVGDAAEIRRLARRRQKNDRRDAELILDLLAHDEFPRLYRYPRQSREVLRQLRFRHKLVKLRTSVLNSLHALSISAGLSLQARLATAQGRTRLEQLRLSPVLATQRDEWLALGDELSHRILGVERWLQRQAKDDEQAQRVQTHAGVGLLTSLCLVHTLGDVTRFASTRKVTAYVGLDVTEHSSAERKVYGGISKAGSRLLRYLLVEAGQTAARSDEQLRDFYQQVMKRRGKAKAKVAVARKLLIRTFIMLRDEIDYAEFLRRGKRTGE